MENQKPEPTKPADSCKNGWTRTETAEIAAIIFPLVEMQKAYGRVMDAKLVMQGWEAILSKKYNAKQICYALEQYALKHGDDFPSPKNINDILDPPKPRISEYAYLEAKKHLEKNGWNQWSAEADVVNAYRQQTRDDNAEKAKHEETMKTLSNQAAQRMIANV